MISKRILNSVIYIVICIKFCKNLVYFMFYNVLFFNFYNVCDL